MIRKLNFKLNWKYALGEVALIFLGISLAIAFQNWNEDRKDILKEQEYLTSLLTEFKADSLKLSSFYQLTSFKDTTAQRLRKELWIDPSTFSDSLFVISNLFINGRYLQYDPFLPTYEQLLSSGQLNIIQNDQLKSAIAKFLSSAKTEQSFFYDGASEIKKDYNKHLYKYFNASIMPYLWEDYTGRELSEILELGADLKGFVDDPESLIMLQNAGAVDRDCKRIYSNNLVRIGAIIEMIKEELE